MVAGQYYTNLFLLACSYAQLAHGFTTSNARPALIDSKKSNVEIKMMPESLHSASTYLATVSADIDNISTDNFKEVFTGGIVVMCGGIGSSLITGLLLDFSGKYDEAMANDAIGDGEDYNVPERSEWTEEQAAEFDELAEKFMAGNVSASGEELAEWMRQFKRDGSVSTPSTSSVGVASSSEKDKALSMFSDYD